jgi:hypothetical protein
VVALMAFGSDAVVVELRSDSVVLAGGVGQQLPDGDQN